MSDYENDTAPIATDCQFTIEARSNAAHDVQVRCLITGELSKLATIKR